MRSKDIDKKISKHRNMLKKLGKEPSLDSLWYEVKLRLESIGVWIEMELYIDNFDLSI